MGLDDTCCDFVSLHAQKRVPLAQSLDSLIREVDWYSRDYPSDAGSQVDALRRAAKRVQRLQGSKDQRAFQGALLWLLKLVDYVGVNRVCGNEPDDAVDKWCSDWLRKLELVSKDQCPSCGATENVEEALDIILNRAADYFDGHDPKRDCAVNIARLTADGMDKHAAKEVANNMVWLAGAMLQASGAGEWDFNTLTALKKIRDTDPEVVAEFSVTETTRVAS